MMARRGVLGMLAGGVAAGLAGCGRSRSTLRYRLTVEVDTPDGVKSGSSVLENVHVGRSTISLPEENGSHTTYGQVPVVDLGGGRYVFALLHDPNYRRSLQALVVRALAYPDIWPTLGLGRDARGLPRELYPAANNARPVIKVKQEDYPMLVTFDDFSDPKTVREIGPDALQGLLGPGSGIGRMIINVVSGDDPLTTGFESRFAAIAALDRPFRPMRRGALRSEDPAGRLTRGNFVWRQK